MRARSRLERINQVLGRWWRKYVADECPDARRERLRLEFIDLVKHDVVLREALRLRAIDRQGSEMIDSEPA